jgi:ornithine cyclodeaminase/alanine dehydrogenase-like protein (mu-crystallin family)
MSLRFVSAEEVARLLPYEECIPLMREAMIALSSGQTRQTLRQIIDLPGGRAFGVMPGARLDSGAFGAKLVSVYPDNLEKGGRSHQGVVALFNGDTGAPKLILDAGEITAIRTAAASAAATDALARPESSKLAIIGYGEQAWCHVEAVRRVRPIRQVRIWGRSIERARDFATKVRSLGLEADASPQVADAVEAADIICTVSAAAEPILFSRWVADGTHINAVGSSRAGPAEIAGDLVARARFFADHREGVLAQGAEFIRAKEAGLIGEDHLLGEIGEVFIGSLEGRRTKEEVTLYKSLGSVVQDLAAAEHIAAKLS